MNWREEERFLGWRRATRLQKRKRGHWTKAEKGRWPEKKGEQERKGSETEKKRRHWRKEKGVEAKKRLKNKEGRR